MAKKKLTRIQRDIAEHPERYDFGDIPPNRVLIPAQEAAYDALAPDWVKQSKANRDHLAELMAKAEIELEEFKANFDTRGKLSAYGCIVGK